MKSSRNELNFQIPSFLNYKFKSFPKLYRNDKNPLFFNVVYIRYMAYIYILFFVWTIGLSDIELSDYRIAGLSDCRIIATAP